MNREEFVDIFSQNVHVSGGTRKFFGFLTYTGNDASSLVPSNFGSRILTIPVGEGFRVLMSRNSALLSKKAKPRGPMSVRATRKAFRNIRDVAGRNGFRLYDITLSRAGENIVSVAGNAPIATEIYEKYAEDATSIPVYMGFRKEGCSISFSVDMRMICQGYIRDAGGLIFDSIHGILSEAPLYGELYQSFHAKHDDQWTARVNPVSIGGNFEGRDKVMQDLETRLPIGLDIRPSRNKGIYFSHISGLWGEIACLGDRLVVYFMTEPDFNLGIELMDALKEMVSA